MVWPFGKPKPEPERTAPTLQQVNTLAENAASRRKDYGASFVDDLTADWPVGPQTMWSLQTNNIANLRARARHVVQNNDYARQFRTMVQANVVGPNGFTLQGQVEDASGVLDKAANQAIERHFAEWCRAENCDVRGRLSFPEICRQVLGSMPADGEFILRGIRRGPMGFQLEVIDPFLLDLRYHDTLPSGNEVRFGVEVDPWMKAVAYWFNESSQLHYSAGKRTRIPAREIYHGYLTEGPEQLRGFPWLSTAMKGLHHLGAYREAAIVNARIGASKMGFLVNNNPGGYAGESGTGKGEAATAGSRTRDVVPGQFEEVSGDFRLEKFDPKYPDGEMEIFNKTVLRGIAAGMGVTYNALANDLEKINLSSIRHGALEEREHWKMLQDWFIGALLQPMYNDWLAVQLKSREGIAIGRGRLRANDAARYRRVRWQGRRWAYTDPHKEMQAHRDAISMGLASQSQIIRETTGRDPLEVLQEIAEFQQAAEDIGVDLSNGVSNAPASSGTAPPDTDGEDDPEESGSDQTDDQSG